MHGEAFAYVKYFLYGEHARKSGNKELADLFEKTANTERFEHLVEEAQLAGLVASRTKRHLGVTRQFNLNMRHAYEGGTAQARPVRVPTALGTSADPPAGYGGVRSTNFASRGYRHT
jgi:rubrerythrin